MSRFPASLLFALAISACDDDPHRAYDSDITFPEAQALIERGARRVDLGLVGSTAHLIEVEHDDELFDDETIDAELLGFAELDDEGACRGTLTLASTPVEVRFDSAVTRFGGLDDAPGCTAFIQHVQDRLAEGARIRVEARRRPPRVPQDGADPLFFADALILTDDDAGNAPVAIELNVGPANLAACASVEPSPTDCVGAMAVLGTQIVAERGVTELEAEDPTELLIFDVDDRVVRVDDGALILEDGTVLRVVDGTQLDDEGLPSVDEVQARLAAGERVDVGGEAVLSASAPTSLIGIELALESRVDGEVEPRPIAVQEQVSDVDPGSGLIVLPLGTDVVVDAMTILDGDFADLEALDLAVEAGAPVRLAAIGTPEALAPRRVILADRLTLRSTGQAG